MAFGDMTLKRRKNKPMQISRATLEGAIQFLFSGKRIRLEVPDLVNITIIDNSFKETKKADDTQLRERKQVGGHSRASPKTSRSKQSPSKGNEAGKSSQG